MAAKNEAKIKFSADTKELNSAIKSAKNEIKDANATIKLAAAEFKNTGDAAEYYAKKSEALEKKLEANKTQQEALTEKIEIAAGIYGDGSEEVGNFERQLTNLQTEEQNILSDINETNSAIQDQAEKTDQANSSMGTLQTTIEAQERELQELQNEYANAWLEGDQQRCDDLAGRISSLNGELETNRQRLSDANEAAANAVEPMNDFAEAEGDADEKGGPLDTILGKVAGNFGGIVAAITAGDLIGLIGQVAGGFMEVVNGAREIEGACQEAEATLAVYTGYMGDDLDQLAEEANKTWAAIAGEQSRDDISATTGALTTRFGEMGESASATTAVFASFGEAFGVSSAEVVNDVADMMMQMHLFTGNTEQDIATAAGILDQLTVACEGTDAKYSDFTGTLQRNATAFRVMGMDTQDAINYMMQFEQAGSSASTAGQTLATFVKNLDGDTKGAAESFAQMQQAMISAEDPMEVLNMKVDGTSKTFEQAFGRQKAQELLNTFQIISDGSIDFAEQLNGADGQLTNLYQSTVTAEEGLGVMQKQFENVTGLPATLGEKLGILNNMFINNRAMGELLTKGYQDMSTKQVKAFQDAQTGVGKANDGLTTSAQNASTRVGSSASTAASQVDRATNQIISDINAIKGSTNFRWSLPPLAMPHFSVSGNFGTNPPTVPTYSVEWYAKGAIMDGAQIFGLNAATGRLMGGGEAGQEAILPIDLLKDYIADALQGNAEQLDYDRLADKIADAARRTPITLEIDKREVGRAMR